MKAALILFVFVSILTPNVLAQSDTLLPGGNLCSHSEWKLVFSDEFNAGSLDKDKWITWYPYSNDGSDQCEFCRTHGNEGQVYTDENVFVNDGIIHLIARRESKKWYTAERQYTSGMIHSRQAFGYGRYEIRCKLPGGMGFWPAFWTFGQKATEIDVFEVGTQKPHHLHTGITVWPTNTSFGKGFRIKTDVTDGFHNYAMVWDTNFIRFEVDSSEVWRISRFNTNRGRTLKRCDIKPGSYRIQPGFPPEGEQLKIIVNLAVGNENTPFTKSPTAKTDLPNQMEIDWIRVYQRR